MPEVGMYTLPLTTVGRANVDAVKVLGVEVQDEVHHCSARVLGSYASNVPAPGADEPKCGFVSVVALSERGVHRVTVLRGEDARWRA